MNKVLLIAAIALLGFGANAQEEAIRFGAKAGLNISSLAGSSKEISKSKAGFHIGAVLEIPISEKFAFQPELIYSSQGLKVEISGGSKGKTNLNYINIPLLAKFYIAEGFSVFAGPQIGILVSAKYNA